MALSLECYALRPRSGEPAPLDRDEVGRTLGRATIRAAHRHREMG